MRRRQNNPILTGEAGVGKTAVVEGFALRVAAGDVPPALKDVSVRSLDLGALQAGAGTEGRVRGAAQEGDRRGAILAQADHHVHRRGAHAHRRGRRGGPERRGQPAQARPGARHAADHRRDDLGRVQEIFREGPGADPAFPGHQGRGAGRAEGDHHGARSRARAGKASQGAVARRGGGSGGQALGPLHPGAAVAGQGGQPDRHGLRARRHQPARHAAQGGGHQPPHRRVEPGDRHPRPRNRRRPRPRRTPRRTRHQTRRGKTRYEELERRLAGREEEGGRHPRAARRNPHPPRRQQGQRRGHQRLRDGTARPAAAPTDGAATPQRRRPSTRP